MESIPVALDQTEHKGMLRFEPPRLVLELMVWSWKAWSRQVLEVEIPTDELAAVRFKSGWWSACLELQVRTIRVVEKVPSQTPGLVRLRVSREFRDAARSLASELELTVSEVSLARARRGLGER